MNLRSFPLARAYLARLEAGLELDADLLVWDRMAELFLPQFLSDRIVLEAEVFDELRAEIEHPRAPNEALRRLFRWR